MSPTFLWVFCSLFLLTFVALIWAGIVQVRAARRVSIEVASILGFSREEKWTGDQLKPLAEFSLFRTNDRKWADNPMEGARDGLQILFMNFSLQAGKAARSQQVIAFRDPRPGLPDFLLQPENLGRKLVAVFVGRDINFEDSDSGVKFSKSYDLRGDDETTIRRAFGGPALEFLAERPGWWAEARNGRLVLWRPNWGPSFFGIRPAEDFVALLDEGIRLRRFLSESLGGSREN